jgi:hypothetical protein
MAATTDAGAVIPMDVSIAESAVTVVASEFIHEAI